MEISAVFGSWTDPVGRYLETRFHAGVFVPCAVFLLVVALAGGAAPNAGDTALAVAVGLGLLLQFRLMDDLADRERDRVAHPGRVLPAAPALAPFHALLACTFLFNLAALGAPAAGGSRSAVFVGLTAFYGWWYGRLRDHVSRSVVRYHVVVAKYPVFVFLVGAGEGVGRRLAAAMTLAYLCFALYEALHDDELRASAAVARVVVLETWALFAVALAMAADLSRGGAAPALVQGLLACAGLALLTRLAGRRRAGVWPARASYLVFAVGTALSLAYSIGGLR
jgi:hypothetical protein